MRSFSFTWAVGWLLHTVTVAQRFAAMNPAPTLSPRYYLAASPLRPLGRRELGPCDPGTHTCSDIGFDSCCPDDTYCMVDPATGSKAKCCAISQGCESPCSESQYQCVVTITITTVTPSITTTSPACCERQCTQTSMFGCPSSLGGGCCSYGQTCASSSQCLWTSKPTSAITSLVSQIPAGCTTSQIACPSSLGGGCCAATQSCTFVGSGPHCAALTVAPTASGVAAVPQNNSNDGLGTGAKAGIGVGVVAGIGLAVGIATWLCLRRRHQRRSDLGTVPDTSTVTAVGTASPIHRRTGLGILSRERLQPEMMGSNTDIGSPNTGGRLRGLTADYFGPAAVPGPFTESSAPHDGASPTSASATTPPGGNNRDRAVPTSPHSPDDITAPVEIDSRAKQRDVSDTIAGRFELYGTELASPYPEEEATLSPNEVVSPYTPSPGTLAEGEMLPSPTLGRAGNR